MLEPIECRQKV